MKKLLFLFLALAMTFTAVPQKASAADAESVHCDRETRSCSMVPVNVTEARWTAMIPYIIRLEELGGEYVEGWNRFQVMAAIFEIEKDM